MVASQSASENPQCITAAEEARATKRKELEEELLSRVAVLPVAKRDKSKTRRNQILRSRCVGTVLRCSIPALLPVRPGNNEEYAHDESVGDAICFGNILRSEVHKGALQVQMLGFVHGVVTRLDDGILKEEKGRRAIEQVA